MSEILISVGSSAAYIGAALGLFILSKWIYAILHSKYKITHELVHVDNVAFTTSYTGYFAGVIAIIGGCIIGPSAGLANDILSIFVYGLAGILCLNFALIISDKVLFPSFSIHKEIVEDRNLGVGILQGAIAFSTGLILMGSIYGEGSWFTVPVFFVCGQIIFLIISRLYNLVLPFNVFKELERNNHAVGIAFSGLIIGIANIIRFAAMKHQTFLDEIAFEVVYDITIGVVLMSISRFIIDKILLRERRLTDEMVNQEHPNIGAGVLEAFGYIATSILVCWVL